ncbi:hypothetical protein [Planctomyces sp. SH-PL14]|uniref:hypothetical protein n=1 Tax=Planctomyces sp. SH-PL14 TaxID=1632864 RepID=UPI00078DA814|nr:hypothetical protein [Planctomyces sp. SH-PL14]AMV19301.1 hypothetical protein VT03_15525 [Planctomyces sp. SH-PL14]
MRRVSFALVLLGLASVGWAQGPALPAAPQPLIVPQTEVIPVVPEAPRPQPTRYETLRPIVPQVAPSPSFPQQFDPPGGVSLTPVPDGTVIPYEQVFVSPLPALPLYDKVRVRQTRNMHPQAVPKLVAIKDPCFGGGCVYVEVCVPPCGREEVCCLRWRDGIRLDYGKYSVDIVTTRRGLVIVDYND